MKHWRLFVLGRAVCFVLGAVVQSGFAQKKESKKPAFSPDLFKGDAKAVATVMLDSALQLAENGILGADCVGRAWYLGGDKTKAQQIFDGVTSAKSVGRSDWIRLARVYIEAGEWDKAQAAFDNTFHATRPPRSPMVEYGVLANLNKDRAKPRPCSTRAMKKNPDKFWHWVNIGGSYLGVRPQ